jgi:hypothetical protein
VSTLSGMAYESMTMMGETTTSAWPAATEDHVRGRASSPSFALFTGVRGSGILRTSGRYSIVPLRFGSMPSPA